MKGWVSEREKARWVILFAPDFTRQGGQAVSMHRIFSRHAALRRKRGYAVAMKTCSQALAMSCFEPATE